MRTAGLHHVTAICSDAQENYNFYANTLGMRLVKRTVNFDDPGAYHLYYGDRTGAPGTILTFFAWPDATMGRPAIGETLAVALSVPRRSLDFWEAHLESRGIESERTARFDAELLALHDPDGMSVELVEADDARPGYDGVIPTSSCVRGLHSVTMRSIDFARTSKLLTELFGARLQNDVPEPSPNAPDGSELARFAFDSGKPGALCDLLPMTSFTRGQMGAGTIHHVAWRTSSDEEQQEWKTALANEKLSASKVMDRSYFRSVYFREPGGVLFEIATDAPGFLTDEAPDALGRDLKLPPQYEASRDQIEAVLPPLHVSE